MAECGEVSPEGQPPVVTVETDKNMEDIVKLEIEEQPESNSMTFHAGNCSKDTATALNSANKVIGTAENTSNNLEKSNEMEYTFVTKAYSLERRRHKCPYCEKLFMTPQKHKNHVRTHTGDKPFVCETCGFRTSNDTALLHHLDMHSNELPFRCIKCDKRFVSSNRLSGHHSRQHAYTRRKCQFCNKRILILNLDSHIAQKHGSM